MSIKVYTKTGDKGQTALVGGHRVSKGEMRLETYGTVDELNALLGMLRAELTAPADSAESKQIGSSIHLDLDKQMARIQNSLFDLGSLLACDQSDIWKKLPSVGEIEIAELEKWIDEMTAHLPELRNFILPGGTRSAATTHLARTICRRAERETVRLQDSGAPLAPFLVQYLNRLSDYLFVLSRELNFRSHKPETLWQPNK